MTPPRATSPQVDWHHSQLGANADYWDTVAANHLSKCAWYLHSLAFNLWHGHLDHLYPVGYRYFVADVALLLAFACAPDLIIDPVHHECVDALTNAAGSFASVVADKKSQEYSDSDDEDVQAHFQDRKRRFEEVMVEFDLTIKPQYLHKRDDICRALETLHIALDPFAVSESRGLSPTRPAADDAVGAAEDQTTTVKLPSGARLSLSEVFMSYLACISCKEAGHFSANHLSKCAWYLHSLAFNLWHGHLDHLYPVGYRYFVADVALLLAFACAPDLIIDPVHHECVDALTNAAGSFASVVADKKSQEYSDSDDEDVQAHFQDRKRRFEEVMVEFDLTIKPQYLHKRDDICRALETLHIALDPFAVSESRGLSPTRPAADDAVGAAEDQTTTVKLPSGARLSLSEVFMSYLAPTHSIRVLFTTTDHDLCRGFTPLIADAILDLVAMHTLFHHTANGFQNYVDVVRAIHCSDEDAANVTSITLIIREHRNGRIVEQWSISYHMEDSEWELKVQQDALNSFNYAVLFLELPFVCDTAMERVIRNVVLTGRLLSAKAQGAGN
ncbi:hypothetical protein AURDEDRAFT_173508 [Auricularia subglabra TFB-10046 SS5]|nr:hypothetical protein AURDEDRAFT_173508 [Auricularia subglabra TFB-10046 SS5]